MLLVHSFIHCLFVWHVGAPINRTYLIHRERKRDNREDILLWNKSIWEKISTFRAKVENDYDGDDNDGDIVWQ